ncbi:MAG: transketolase [Mollicutes bacterium]|nr:transketolase [Mollicutes bacterium]
MRSAFVDTLFCLAKKDKKIKIVTGDLGFGVLKPFYDDLSECFINAGIAEQNMTSFAAGMAIEGLKPVTYSIGNFPTLRCLEQIRNDICYPNANVKIVCVGGGYTYGVLGVSHHATEDIGVMRSLPNIIILSPCDKNEAISCTKYMMHVNRPCYLRLGRNGSANFTDDSILNLPPTINKIIDGKDAAIFCTGEIISEAIKASCNLRQEHGISIAVFSCPILKPFPSKLFLEIISQNHFNTIMTLEEHNVINGLGTIVNDCFCFSTNKPKIIKLGIDDLLSSAVGNQQYLRQINSIDSAAIINEVLKLKNDKHF